jgi:tetrahydromethanopterin S-methyltransferase subunit G
VMTSVLVYVTAWMDVSRDVSTVYGNLTGLFLFFLISLISSVDW